MTPPVSMILTDKISAATWGRVIARNNLKFGGGSLISLFCLLFFCAGVERVGKGVRKPDGVTGLISLLALPAA